MVKVRKLPDETVGPARKKRKKPEKRFGIESRYTGKTSKWWPFHHDGEWHVASCDWFAKEVDRDHELAKRRRGWEKRCYEFREVER